MGQHGSESIAYAQALTTSRLSLKAFLNIYIIICKAVVFAIKSIYIFNYILLVQTQFIYK